jgi:hypothetical protein
MGIKSKVNENPLDAQNSIYGEGDGPPMIQNLLKPTNSNRRKRPKKPSVPKDQLLRQIRSKNTQETFSVCDLPGDFPPQLVYRALAAYSFLRTLSLPLRLSPFTPNVFLRALYLPLPNTLMGEVHVALLRILMPNLDMGYSYKQRGGAVGIAKRRHADNLRWPLRAGDNLMLLDGFTWPLFYDDYCHLTADQLYASMHDNNKMIDFRYLGMPYGYDNFEEDEPYSSLRTSSQHTIGHGPYSQVIHGQAAASNRSDQAVDESRDNNKSPIVLDAGDSDSEYTSNDEPAEESEEEIEDWAPKKKYRKRARKSQPPVPAPATPFPHANYPNIWAPGGGVQAPVPHPMMYHHPSSTAAPFPASGLYPTNYPPMMMPRVQAPVGQPSQSTRPSAQNDTKNKDTSTEPDLMRIKGGGPSGSDGGGVDDTKVGSESSSGNQQNHHLPKGQTTTSHEGPGPSKAPSRPQHDQTQQYVPTSHQIQPADPLPSDSVRQAPSVQFVQPVDKVASDTIKAETKESLTKEGADSNMKTSNGLDKKESSNSTSTTAEQVENNKDEDDESIVHQSEPMNHWPQFEPLKHMRDGLPYHCLPLEQKLNILEFLIDEMLCVDVIAAEFSKRQNMTGWYGYPYGVLPSESELQDLENNDECAVCDGEGELLCCDGCVASYHRQCIGMSVKEALPDGKWLCPECQLVDPTNFGSLRGGRKASLDWFTIDDMETAIERSKHVEPGVVDLVDGPEKQPSEPSKGNESKEASQPRDSSQPQDSPVKGFELLVIHGFIFCRPKDRQATVADKALKPDEPEVPLHYDHLGRMLQAVGLEKFRSWPLGQVPMRVPPPGDRFPSKRQYFWDPCSFDPTMYNNKYKDAPIPLTMKAGQGSLNSNLFHASFETECSAVPNYQIAEALGRDTTLDKYVSECLLFDNNFHDPFKSAKSYMIRLETQLRRACLLDEFWEVGKNRARNDIWIANVQKCKSVNRLARLFVKLVNRIHLRAFSEAWFHNPHSRNSDKGKDDSEERLYVHLPNDWDKKAELRKRTWERTPAFNILPLLASENVSLERLVDGIITDSRREVNAPRSKRKRNKVSHSSEATKPPIPGGNSMHDPMTGTAVDATPKEHQALGLVTSISEAKEEKEISRAEREKNETTPDTGESRKSSTIQITGDPVESSEKGFASDSVPADKLKFAGQTSAATEQQSLQHESSIELSPVNAFNPETESESIQIQDAGQSTKPVDAPNVESVEPGKTMKEPVLSKSPVIDPKNEAVVSSKRSDDTQANGQRKCTLTTSVETKETPPTEISSQTLVGSDTPSTDDHHESVAEQLSENKIQEEDSSMNIEEQTPASVSQDDADENSKTTGDHVQVDEKAGHHSESLKTDGKDDDEGVQEEETKQAKKPKKRKRSKSTGASSRTRRRSGRIQTQQHAESSFQSSERTPSAPAEPCDLFISKQIEKKISEMEKILTHSFTKEIHWPVAGRIPFEPQGHLSPSEMKRLGRKGGTVKAPHVEYNTSYEVGHVNVEQMWRRNTELCRGLEDLLLQIRILESYLDRSVSTYYLHRFPPLLESAPSLSSNFLRFFQAIHSCEGITRRSKSSITKIIQCSQRDPETGVVAHFVVNKNRGRGFWVSSECIELSSLILDKHTRRREQVENFTERMRAKADEEARRLRERKMQESAEAARISEEEARQLQERRMREAGEALRKREEEGRAKMARQKQKELEEKQLQSQIRLQVKFDFQLDEYEQSIRTLLNDCLIEGIFPIPTDRILALRTKAFPGLRSARDALTSAGLIVMEDKQLAEELFARERKVISPVANPTPQRFNDGSLPQSRDIGISNAKSGDHEIAGTRNILSKNSISSTNNTTNPVLQTRPQTTEAEQTSSLAQRQDIYNGKSGAFNRAKNNTQPGSLEHLQARFGPQVEQNFYGGTIQRDAGSSMPHAMTMNSQNSFNGLIHDPRSVASARVPQHEPQPGYANVAPQQFVHRSQTHQYPLPHIGWHQQGLPPHTFQGQPRFQEVNQNRYNPMERQSSQAQDGQNRLQQFQDLQQQINRMQQQGRQFPPGNYFG